MRGCALDRFQSVFQLVPITVLTNAVTLTTLPGT